MGHSDSLADNKILRYVSNDNYNVLPKLCLNFCKKKNLVFILVVFFFLLQIFFLSLSYIINFLRAAHPSPVSSLSFSFLFATNQHTYKYLTIGIHNFIFQIIMSIRNHIITIRVVYGVWI